MHNTPPPTTRPSGANYRDPSRVKEGKGGGKGVREGYVGAGGELTLPPGSKGIHLLIIG